MFKLNENFDILKRLIEQNQQFHEERPSLKETISYKQYLKEYRTIKLSMHRQSGLTTAGIILGNVYFNYPLFIYEKDIIKDTIIRISRELHFEYPKLSQHASHKQYESELSYLVNKNSVDCLIFDCTFLWNQKDIEIYYDVVSQTGEFPLFLFLQ